MATAYPVEKFESVKSMLMKPEVKAELMRGLPKMLSIEHFIRTTLSVLRMNPGLLDCTKASLLGAILGAAQIGLELEPTLGQAYIVPFKDKSRGTVEAVLIPGYRGYLTLARRSGEVSSVTCEPVYDKDLFEIEFGTNGHIKHIPLLEEDRGKFRGCYIVYKFKDGGEYFTYMSLAEIEAIKKRSKAGSSGPWETDFIEMAKKTTVRRSIKYVPVSIEMQKAAGLEDRFYGGESQGLENLLPFDQTKELEAPTETFERLLAGKNYNKTDLEEFLVEVARGNNLTVEEIKQQASKDFDHFWQSFLTYAQQEDAPTKEKSGDLPVEEEATLETEQPSESPPELGPGPGPGPEPAPQRELPIEKTKKGKEEKPPTKEPPTTPPPAKNGAKAKVKCPNIGAMVDMASCEQWCKHRKGCPAFEGVDNK
jgi:recombination protein RecT